MYSSASETQKNCKNNEDASQKIIDLNKTIRNQAAEIKLLKSKLQNFIHTENLPNAHTDSSEKADENRNEFSKNENVKNFPILLDLFDKTANKSKNFDKETINLANDICFLSPRSHQLLIKNLNFPSRYLINKQINEEFSQLLNNFSKIEKANEIIHLYKEKCGIHDVIDATLSVDALFFHPVISISNRLDLSGIEVPSEEIASLPHNVIELFQSDPELFECFIEKNSKFVIRAAFLFQIQPLNISYRSFIIHMKEAFNGKSNSDIINLLFEISKISKNMNINIRAFSFDGDGAYKELNNRFYASYTKTLFERSNIFSIKLNFKRISPDPLHLYKRLRYRLFTNRIHSGFSRKKPFINLFRLRAALKNLPSSVFNNSPLSKMHDDLPLSLFSVHSLKILYEKREFIAFAYFFPITCSIIAFENESLSKECRCFLFECSFWFLIQFKTLLDLVNIEKKIC